MTKGLAYESDRGCIIVAAAILDKLLEDIILEHIKKHAAPKTLTKSLFDLSGPISNLSAKISICRAFGLIDDLAYKDLMIIRKLRNSFAHETEKASFTLESVRQKIKSMHFVQHCMREIEIERYSKTPTQKSKQERGKMLEEWEMLTEGFLNYEKVMFCFAIDELEYHINFYSKFRQAPPATVSQLLRAARQANAKTI